MRVVVLSGPLDLSAYITELLHTWGLVCDDTIGPHALPALDPSVVPVAICPTGSDDRDRDAALIDYAHRGGTVICFLPQDILARAAGLDPQGDKEPPQRLRVTAFPAAGLSGETLPIVGRIHIYEHAPEATVLGYLSHPGQYEGESVGFVETPVGSGRILAFAFDLPLCVLLLRQGDPDHAEVIPQGDRTVRPSHLASSIGPSESGWVPFADLLARLLVDLVRRYVPAPVPLLSHLPGSAPGILLYSGDEDNADVASTDDQLSWIAEAGGRMNLYIIPIQTQSSEADVARYRTHNDVGPHPMLTSRYQEPLSARLTELERQIRMFSEMFGVRSRSLRNHSTAWAGYLEPVEVMERLGVRMDGNFSSGTYKRDRQHAPYAAFGAAMPVRFCKPEGELLDVFQQHTHLSDDAAFGDADYSYRLSRSAYATELERIYSDIATRFHTPYGVCIHPGNWVRYSRSQGQDLIRQADQFDLPTWSFDQWLSFWDARSTWTLEDVTWSGSDLTCQLHGETSHSDLRVALPVEYEGLCLISVDVDGEDVEPETVTRFREKTALVPIESGKTAVTLHSRYDAPNRNGYRGETRAPCR